jgi:predicted Rossmann fold nucleotide-binding protein DprA/Smf involved in DNA uptake
MKIAIIGSRSIAVNNIGDYIMDCEEIVSGGAVGIDTCAMEYAKKKKLKLTVFLPQYERYGRAAPIIRNKEIVNYADRVVAFWDGKSKGTLSVIKYAQKVGKPCEIVLSKK